MAPEKQVKEGMFSGMPTKQKLIIAAVIIIMLVIIWQVVELMGIGGSTTPPPVMKQPANQAAKSVGATPAQAGVRTAFPANNQAMQQAELKQAQVASDTRFVQLQQESEQRYLSKINDLEDLKIQRAIAETNQAIATAKLATVTAEKSISDLLTKPVVPEVPAGIYANKLTSPTNIPENMTSLPGGGQLPPGISNSLVSSPSSAEYTVISVSMQLGKWSAVVGYQGKLYNVVVGDVLPADNSVVVRINKNGVVLRKGGKSRKVSIMSAI